MNGSYAYTYFYKSYLPPGNYTLKNTNNTETSIVTNFIKYEPSTVNYGQAREAPISFASGNLNQVARFNIFLSILTISNNASIIGRVYIDRNNNELFEPNGADNNPLTLEDNDVPLKDVDVDLSRTTGSPAINRNLKTDEQGKYQITDLPAGIFKILVDLVQK